MFDFRKIELKDKYEINEKLAVSDFRGCEYSFANNLAWNRLNDTLITMYKGFYICCSICNGQPVITFPTGYRIDNYGKEKYLELFKELKNYFLNIGKQLVLSSVTKENLEWLKEYYKDNINIKSSRDSYDYIYSSEKLIKLSGKKYHGKRNHIKHFKESDWSFEPLTEKDFDNCTFFAAKIYNETNKYDDFSAIVEQYAIYTYLNNFEYLNLKGGVLRQNNEFIGFTIGEQINSDTFVVHIEKSNSEIRGAYPTLCNEFAKREAVDTKYINREEDLGIEGLRKSKMSYHPEFLLEKYIISFK